MSENIKLSFDDGYKNIEINGDPNKVIRINPTDMAFVKRISGLGDKAKEISDKYGDIDFSNIEKLENLDPEDPDFTMMKKAAEAMDKAEKSIRELIDSAFEYPVCDIVFGELNCLSPAGGVPIYINFIRVIFEYITKEMQKQNAESEARMSKYTIAAQSVTPKPKINIKPAQPLIPYAKPTLDIGSMTAEEKNALLQQLLT